MREEERHRYVKKVKTVGENTISDHKPKKLVLDISKKKKWRRRYAKKRIPTIQWEKLRGEEMEKKYQEEIERKMGERGVREPSQEETGWMELQEIVVGAAKEVCGVREKRV